MARNGRKTAQSDSVFSQWVRAKDAAQTRGAEHAEVDWSAVNSSLVCGAVIASTRMGGAILFGQSRDRFMFALTLYFDGDKRTEYFRSDEGGIEALSHFLNTLIEWGDVLM